MTLSVNGLVNTNKALAFVMDISGKDCYGRLICNNIFICLQIPSTVEVFYLEALCSDVKGTRTYNYEC